jgi:poly(3-hydroxybutyrate) depolymerase
MIPAIPPAPVARDVQVAACDQAPAARTFTFGVTSDGLHRTALVHVPKRVGALPVLLVLHFATGTGPEMAKAFAYSKLADRRGFIAVYPTSGHDRGFWNVVRNPAKPDDVQFMRDLISALPAKVCMNARRVSATGVSNGASMTGVLGCLMADRLAAIAPVSGGYTTYTRCHPSTSLTAYEVHGTADRVVSYSGVKKFTKVWRRVNGCNASPTAKRSAGGLVRYRWTCTRAPLTHLKLIGRGHFLNYKGLESSVWNAVRHAVR